MYSIHKISRCFVLIFFLILGSSTTRVARGYTPLFTNTHVLDSGALAVEVMDPVAVDRQDQGVRFSPMAWVIQANLHDTDYFYAPTNPIEPPWNNNPNRYPGGSPMEFDLGDFNVRPPGFDEATFGGADDEFIKIGVGILRRTVSGNYHQGNDYQFVAANTQVNWQPTQATFTQSLPRETDTGYRYELETTMRVHGNRLLLDYALTNNGSKAFQTAQYLHNFTAIGGEMPSTSSEIEVPWSFTVQGNVSGALTQQSNKLVYVNNPRGRKPTIPVDNLGAHPYEFIVRQTNLDEQYIADAVLPDPVAGATAVPLGISSWNDNSGIQFSPEQFVLLSLDPGNTISWSRTYTFGNVPEPGSAGLVLTAGLLLLSSRRRLVT